MSEKFPWEPDPISAPPASGCQTPVLAEADGKGEGVSERSVNQGAKPVRRVPKLSVSLYQTDLERLDEIKEFMRQRGHRNLSDSEALRLACRAVEISDRFLTLYQDMQREDRRRKP